MSHPVAKISSFADSSTRFHSFSCNPYENGGRNVLSLIFSGLKESTVAFRNEEEHLLLKHLPYRGIKENKKGPDQENVSDFPIARNTRFRVASEKGGRKRITDHPTLLYRSLDPNPLGRFGFRQLQLRLFYLLPTYEDYYGGYYGHHYGGYGQDRDTYTPSVSYDPSFEVAKYFNRGQVATSPKSLPYLDPRVNDITADPTTNEAVLIAVVASRQPATPAATPNYYASAVSRAPSFDAFDIAIESVRLPATHARGPAISYAAPAVSRAAIPANAAVPAFRYIPGHPYGTPVIYGYSSGAYTYYSPSVLSPYSYGSH
ncbi:hypothetical protein AVEN_59984-1 [Araneus ventricosus]|uniref:Uncharacterized protein n=1 Tax=Araneus ventricosus TaxID=182803 RepID=A0A4Y2P9Q5_ARAVE|nr:hypothetical protein AVEN_59984-1 [Araneus ventricosus]